MNRVPPAPRLEVVICTYNNAGMLDQALSALGRQQPVEAGRWSCVVVDNNCTDATRPVVEKHVREGLVPGLRIVREPEQGLTPARLRGVRCSTAPWIAMVDDDCLLQPDWIQQALAFAEGHPGVGAFGGRVILDFEVEPPPYVRTFSYSFAEQEHGDSRRQVPFLVGAGLVVSRSALSACGWVGGPVLADRVGGNLVSGGDVEIVLRIASRGFELWYVPECRLLHRIPSRRTSLGYLSAINRSLGVSQALADTLVWEGTGAAWVAGSARKVFDDAVSLARAALSVARGRRPAAELCVQAGFGLGRIQGICRILRMPRGRRGGLMGLARPAPGRASRASGMVA